MSATLVSDKLKAALLQSAIQGKLTEQRSEDGDARDLLKQIEAEKERLMNEKLIKKEKPLPEITEDEIPFDIPDSWVWVRLNNISTKISDGSHNPPKDNCKGFHIISAKNIKNRTIDFSLSDRFVSEEDFIKEDKRTNIRKGDVLLTIVGTIGESCVVEIDTLFVAQRSVSVIKTLINPYYLMNIFFSPLFISFARQKASGTAQKGIYLNTIKQFCIPLPPLPEQHRIVKALETALAKIDKLKVDETKLYNIQKAFPNKFRASLLQSAIQGKLTQQLPEDGDARDLLKQIEAEKARLINEKLIKKEKPLPEITENEIPFDIPDNWVWMRLGDVGQWGAGATPNRGNISFYKSGTYNWLKTGDLTDGEIFEIPEKITELALQKTSVKLLPKGSVLIAMYGATTGKLGILAVEATTNQACCGCITFTGVLNRFLFYFLLFNRDNFIAMGAGGAQPNISKEKIITTLIPIPPLSEQHRIVEALETALAKIDKLNKLTE